MTVPTIRVEAAFGLGAYSEPTGGQWVDITAHVLEIQTQRGRQSEFEQFPAGTATITLNNDDRTYDPLNSAGPYYGNLKDNTHIRVVATISAVDYHVWRGYVDGWPAHYTDAGYRSEVQVQCTDAFRLLAGRRMQDTFRGYLTNAGFGLPTTWYPCDTSAAGVIKNVGAVGKPFAVASSISDVASLSIPTGSGALELPAQTSSGISIIEISYAAVAPVLLDSRDNPTPGTTFTISALIRTSDVKDKGILCTLDKRPIQVVEFGLFVSGGQLVARLAVNTDGGLTADNTILGSTNLADGNVHHIVGVRNGTTLRVYVDGALDGTSTVGGASGSMEAAVGTMQLGRGWTSANGASGIVTVDEIMAWQTAFAAADVAVLWQAFDDGLWAERLSGVSIGDVLQDIGWGGDTVIDAGETMTQLPQQPGGTPALDMLQRITTTESGRLFMDAQGRLVFHDRGRELTETVENTVQYTFSAQTRDTAPAGVGLLDRTLSLVVDDKLTFDAAEVTREGGAVQTATATATPARTYTATGTLHIDDQQAAGLANWTVFRYGTALPRSESWEIDPETMPADWDNILSLDIGHRIKHDFTPGGIGSSINLEQHISLIAHSITPEQWIITMNGTPVDPNGAAYFLWATGVTADNDNGWADTDGTPPGGYWG